MGSLKAGYLLSRSTNVRSSRQIYAWEERDGKLGKTAARISDRLEGRQDRAAVRWSSRKPDAISRDEFLGPCKRSSHFILDHQQVLGGFGPGWDRICDTREMLTPEPAGRDIRFRIRCALGLRD